jgi:hypothetical protein
MSPQHPYRTPGLVRERPFTWKDVRFVLTHPPPDRTPLGTTALVTLFLVVSDIHHWDWITPWIVVFNIVFIVRRCREWVRAEKRRLAAITFVETELRRLQS